MAVLHRFYNISNGVLSLFFLYGLPVVYNELMGWYAIMPETMYEEINIIHK